MREKRILVEGAKGLNIRFPPEEKARLETLSELFHRSQSDVIRWLVTTKYNELELSSITGVKTGED